MRNRQKPISFLSLHPLPPRLTHPPDLSVTSSWPALGTIGPCAVYTGPLHPPLTHPPDLRVTSSWPALGTIGPCAVYTGPDSGEDSSGRAEEKKPARSRWLVSVLCAWSLMPAPGGGGQSNGRNVRATALVELRSRRHSELEALRAGGTQSELEALRAGVKALCTSAWWPGHTHSPA